MHQHTDSSRTPLRRRSRSLVKRSFLVVAVGLVAALAAPGLVATAGNGTPLDPNGGAQGECEATGVAFEFPAKTPGDTVAEGTYNIPGGGTITFSNGDPGFIDFVSTVPVAAIVVKKGNEADAVTTFNPPVLEGTAATNAPLDGEASPSHITICFGGEVPPTTAPPPPAAAEVPPPPPAPTAAPPVPAPVRAQARLTG